MFNDLSEAIAYIEAQVKFKPKADLDRMNKAYEMLGLNLDGVRKIHVAGTNGKGSTSSYITSILSYAGYKVGLFQSPYILVFNERIKIGKRNISNEDLLEYINRVVEFGETFRQSYGETLSFFELITLVALLFYQDQKVDFIVMEVGIGGLLDATNILDYDLSLITNIGYDHMKVLGNTLESIALNKLGIVKKGGHLISTVDQSLHPLFIEYCDQVGATYKLITESPLVTKTVPTSFEYLNMRFQLNMMGIHQVKNVMLATEAMLYFFPNYNRQFLSQAVIRTKLPARMQRLRRGIYLDGAHNTSGVLEIVKHIKYEGRQVDILFSALADKDIKGMLELLEPVAHKIVLTSFEDERFTSLEEFADDFITYNPDCYDAFKDLYEAKEKDTDIYILGSLHFASYFTKVFKEFINDLNEFAYLDDPENDIFGPSEE